MGELSRVKIVQQIVLEGAVAIIRVMDPDKVMHIASALKQGGLSCIEISMSTPGTLKLLEQISLKMEHEILLGVGSVLDAETARLAILAGARYIVSPVVNPEIIQLAHRYDIPAIPGAFTPTEILHAQELGADLVKVFPADILGIPFIQAIRAPMPHLQLMPTGGITVDNAGEWIKAGASVVGIGSALVDKKMVENAQYHLLTQRAELLRENITEARR